MRQWRCFPGLAVLLGRAALACAAPLPLTLGACAFSGTLPSAQVGSIAASEASGAPPLADEAPSAALRRHFADATAQLAAWLKMLPGACSSPCMSPAEEEAIIARAVAEHEMRRP
jgi:hypothetical protein